MRTLRQRVVTSIALCLVDCHERFEPMSVEAMTALCAGSAALTGRRDIGSLLAVERRLYELLRDRD